MARPRTPTALKLVKGTAKKHRLNPKEPKPLKGRPVPPSTLTERARRVWDEICETLDKMGVLTTADNLAVEGLAEALGELREVRKALALRGGATSYMSETQGGGVIWRPYPEVAQISDADRRFGFWVSKVGATPADRSKVSAVGKDDEKDPWANL